MGVDIPITSIDRYRYPWQIDAKTRNEWTFSGFTRLVPRLLGRELSALGPRELETLKAFHQQHPRMHEALVRQAVADVDSPTITHVLLRIQTLLEQGAP